MKKKFRKEILRKLFHLYQLIVIVGYIGLRYYLSERIATFALAILLMIILEYEFLRLEWKVKIPDPFGIMRTHEKKAATGTLFLVLATIVVFAVFDFKIALVALLITVFGDLVSAIVGIGWGKIRIYNGKSLEGFGAGLVMNLLVASIFLWEYPLLVLVMALVASVVELFTYKLDDNLTVPIFSGFAGQMLAYLLGLNLVQLTNPIQDLGIFLSNVF
ncbi:diacylglycerol/polyprenol kinase family protein [Patescibacteria group bacterium]